MRYRYGHIKGRDASCSTSCTCQLNRTRVVEDALEEETAHVFYVYAVIIIGNGNFLTDVLSTLLGMKVNYICCDCPCHFSGIFYVLGSPTNINVQESRTFF